MAHFFSDPFVPVSHKQLIIGRPGIGSAIFNRFIFLGSAGKVLTVGVDFSGKGEYIVLKFQIGYFYFKKALLFGHLFLQI